MKAEAVVNQRNVVVDCFWHSNERHDNLSLKCSLLKSVYATVSAVTAYDVDLSDLFGKERIQDLICIESTSGRSKDRTAFLMNVLHHIRRESNPIMIHVSIKTFVAPLDTVDLLHLVVVVKAHEQFADHHIEARTKTTTSHDTNFCLLSIAEDVGSWTSLNELNGTSDIPVRRVGIFCGHEVLILDKLIAGKEARAILNIFTEVCSDKW